MRMNEKINRILTEKGWTQERLAEHVGVSQSTVHRWIIGENEPRGLSRDTVNALFVALDFSQLPNANVLPATNQASTQARKITVYGQAVAGVCGEFEMNGNALYEVMAPPNLISPKAYAIIFSGDSMWPRYDEGMIGYVDPERRPKKGDYVVAQIKREEHGPLLAFAKRLVRHNEKELVLEQLNPPDDPDNPGQKLPHEMRFPGDQVVSVHVIVMAGEA